MSKVTSWDRTVYEMPNGVNSPHTSHAGIHKHACRVVLWPEGAPDPSTVPHAGERVQWAGAVVLVVTGIATWGEVQECWTLAVRSGGGSIAHRRIADLTRIPDTPTIEVSGDITTVDGRRHHTADVVDRCAGLPEVDG